MHVIRRRGWEIPERQATPERVFLNRRAFLAASGASALALSPELAVAQRLADLPDPTKDLYPVKRNEKYVLDRAITEEKVNVNYNNFYEFGSSKQIARAAQALKLRPWTIKIDGMVEKEQELGIDDLIKKVELEERLYRHRCVEAWGMTVPWSGFPLAKLVELEQPLSSAKYLRMETFMDPATAPGQKVRLYPWPYIEGLTAPTAMAFDPSGALLIAEGGYDGHRARIFGFRPDGSFFEIYPHGRQLPLRHGTQSAEAARRTREARRRRALGHGPGSHGSGRRCTGAPSATNQVRAARRVES